MNDHREDAKAPPAAAPAVTPDDGGPAALPEVGGPHWPTDAIHNTGGELLLFASTVVAFARHPNRFAAAWVRRQQRALNPLAFMATSATILGLSRLVSGPLFAALSKAPPEAPLRPAMALLRQAWDAAAPHVNFLLLGLIAHLVCRLLGSRAKLRDSAAVALFAGGGPVALAELILTTGAAFLVAAPGAIVEGRPVSTAAALFLAVAALASFLVFVITFALAMAAVHRGASRARTVLRTTAALVCAYALSGVIYGAVQLPGSYGLHFEVIWKRNAEGKLDMSVLFKA